MADASVLLPVVNGALASCRKSDVRFVRVQITLDYTALFAAGHTGPKSIKSMYYIELPSTSVPMLNGHGVAYNLLTYHGPADLRTMTAAEVLTQIVNPCLQQGPITLENADFNLATANVDTTKHRDVLNTKILTLDSRRYALPCLSSSAPAIPTSLTRSSSTFASQLQDPTANLSSRLFTSTSNVSKMLPGLLPPAKHCLLTSAADLSLASIVAFSHPSAACIPIMRTSTISQARLNARNSLSSLRRPSWPRTKSTNFKTSPAA